MKQSEEVMSNELVDRMQKVREAMRKDGWDEKGLCMLAVNDAITALSSQDDARDRALKEVAAMCILRADELNDTRSAYDGVAASELMAMSERIRALKSKPTTEERRTGDIQWASSRPADPACWPSSGPITQPPAPEVKQGDTFTEAHRKWMLSHRFPGHGEIASFEQWICAELDTRLGGKS